MTDLEDKFVAECRRQGYQPDQHAMAKAAVDLCGGNLTEQGLIHMPNLGVIAPADFVRSLHGQMPEAFQALDAKPTIKPTGNLTVDMKAEIAANRRQRALPSDWLAVRSKATGTTAQHLAERERNWE
jgi:hypothetical protein